ncbi:MAG: methyltransferase domain-containing protein [Chloroflexi bacterium]|nr:methyltransferase domain-containing protein [Chloroflexota bacterium]
MRPEDFRALLTPPGQAALADAAAFEPREKDFLSDFQMLAKRHPPDLARAALETAILRREAAAKFPQAARMYFTRPALEQATPHAVAAHRAARFARANLILDLACSIGGDALALAHHAPVVGLDLDPLRLAMARANAAALGLPARFIETDLRRLPLARRIPDTAAFFDPARRADDGRRAFSVERYEPPLSIIHGWLPRLPALAVKVSPGVALDELEGYDCEIEFVSLHGDLKEAVLWFGPFKSARRRATLLPGGHTLTDENLPQIPVAPPRAYLYEPDPAVLRAGLVAAVGAPLEAAQLDPHIAYLTADRLTETPFARAWAVEDWLPFNLKRLRAALRERNVGRVTVKKRGSPLEPEALIRDLRLKGQEERILFLTHHAGQHIVLIARPTSTPAPQESRL